MKYIWFLIFIGCSVNIHSINERTIAPVVRLHGPEIGFWTSGGALTYQTDSVLFIDSTGYASNKVGYPVIGQQLSHEEYQNIISMFHAFDTYSEIYSPRYTRCYDGGVIHIKYKTDKINKTISIVECSFDKDSLELGLVEIKRIVKILRDLSDSIYKNNDNPWNGLTVEFNLEKSRYRLNEPIRLSFTLINSMNIVRKIYFPYERLLYFEVYKDNHFIYPYSNFVDKDKPREISIQPHHIYNYSYTWNYARDSTIHLVEGTYTLTMALMLGRYIPELGFRHPITFVVTDSTDH